LKAYKFSNKRIKTGTPPRSLPPLIAERSAAGDASSEGTPDYIADGRRENFVPRAEKMEY
jgi:hypothetical protein